MLVYLVITATLFFPTWDKKLNPDELVLLSETKMAQESMTDCVEAMQSIEDIKGLYKKTYPFEDRYYIAVVAKCVRLDEESKAPERDM